MKAKVRKLPPITRFPISTLGLMFLAFGTLAHADTAVTSWSGASSSAWNTAGNWSTGVPSATASSVFNSTFSTQPQLSSGQTTQGIWAANGLGQDVTIGTSDGSTQRQLTITGTATLSGQTNAGIIMDDSGNRNLTLGGSTSDPLVVAVSNSTGFYVNNAGTLTLQGNKNLAIAGTNTLTLGGNNASGKIIITRAISAATGFLSVNTAGTVTLSAQNTIAGTTLTAGTLNINNSKALGISATSAFAINGGTIDNTSGAAITAGFAYPISIGGNFTFTGGTGTTHDLNLGAGAVDLGGGTRTITANAGKLTLGGVISNGGLTKAGSGTLAVSGNNTYTGGTTASGGTLLIAAGGSINSSANVSVSNGATVQNASGAAITPLLNLSEGASLVTSASSSSFTPTSLTLSGNLADGWTAISLTATLGSGLIKSGDLTLSLTGITAGTYSLTSGTGFSGIFSSANVNGTALTLSGSDFVGSNIGGFDYIYTNSTNVLQVTAVPEPAAWGLLALTLPAAFLLRRRRIVS